MSIENGERGPKKERSEDEIDYDDEPNLEGRQGSVRNNEQGPTVNAMKDAIGCTQMQCNGEWECEIRTSGLRTQECCAQSSAVCCTLLHVCAE